MKKGISLLLILLVIGLLTGCAKKTKIEDMNVEDIFTTEGKYFVFFYKDDCADCEKTKPLILSYLEIIDDSTEYEGKKTIYGVNLSKEANKFAYRTYTQSQLNWGAGQGNDGSFWVNGVTSADKLYIGATSALVSVGVNSQNERFTTFIASGYDAISQFLTEYLG